MKFVDIAGKKLGKLIVLDKADYKLNNSIVWRCRCDCGKITFIRSIDILSGHTKSCGCLRKSVNKEGDHYKTHQMSYSKIYSIYNGIKQRCNNVNHTHYKHYGGRGITYDPNWETFEGFWKDMKFKWIYSIKQLKLKNPSIERIDVNGNYCFENCIFIELKEQNKNRTNTKKVINL